MLFPLGQASSAFTGSKSFTNLHTNYYNYLRSKINPSAGALYALGSCRGPSSPQGGGACEQGYMCQMTRNETEILLPMINVQVAIKYFSFLINYKPIVSVASLKGLCSQLIS